MKKLILAIIMVVCVNCRPLTSGEATVLSEEPSMIKIVNLDWNNLCFNVINYKDEYNYKIDINVDNDKNLYVDIQDNEISKIRYDRIEKNFLTTQNILYYIKQKAR